MSLMANRKIFELEKNSFVDTLVSEIKQLKGDQVFDQAVPKVQILEEPPA